MTQVIDPRRFGKYQILRRISIGGMAEVYHAVFTNDQGFEKEVAVKRILPLMDQEQSFTEMFIHEAKLASTLNHANIAQIYELGEIGNSYFIAMEYIHGETVRAVIRRMNALGARVDPWLAARIVADVASGLQYAHQKRGVDGQALDIVHRDISPQNVMLSFNGQVKVIDFGIAKATGRAFQTRSGIVKGKCSYMAPEQIRGRPVDHRTDIFALGIVFFELLSGEKLFDGTDVGEIMDKITEEPMDPHWARLPPDLPADLRGILQKMLERDADRRYETAAVVHRDLMNAILSCEKEPGADAITMLLLRLFPDSSDDRKLIEEYAAKQRELLDCAEDRGEETTDQQHIGEGTGVFATDGLTIDDIREKLADVSPQGAVPSAIALNDVAPTSGAMAEGTNWLAWNLIMTLALVGLLIWLVGSWL
ncbi:MAG: serine/threonine protein kinase [Myxococcales bacterium]|nr:serine/threonine protein kinase [Myxococcales bacterium]